MPPSDIGNEHTNPQRDEPDEANAIDNYIRALGELPIDSAKLMSYPPSGPEEDGDYMCTEQDFVETAQYDSVVAYAVNSDSLWPGAIIRGDSVYCGQFTQLVFDRQPITISVSLANLVGARSAIVANPSLSAYRDALAGILSSEVTGATPANIYWAMERVHGQGQLTLALGANTSWVTGGIDASFDFASETIRSRYLVKYVQEYYTVDLDPPARPSSLFGDSVTLDEVEAAMWEDNPPIYVSSVTYGRMIVFAFESSYSSEELAAALEFAYSGGLFDANVNVTSAEILSESKMVAYIIGGSGSEAAQAFDDYEELRDFIQSGGDFSLDSPGAPISYKLAYLKDNSPARLSFTDEYTVTECQRVNLGVKVTLMSIQVVSVGLDPGAALEVYGDVWATDGVNDYTLLVKGAGDAVAIDEGETWPATGVISETVMNVNPQPGTSINLVARLYDEDTWPSADDDLGTMTVSLPYEAGWRTGTTMYLTGDGAQVALTFALEPI